MLNMVKKSCTECSEAVIVMLWVNCDEEVTPVWPKRHMVRYTTYKDTDFTIIKYHYDTYTKIKAEVTVFLAK